MARHELIGLLRNVGHSLCAQMSDFKHCLPYIDAGDDDTDHEDGILLKRDGTQPARKIATFGQEKY
jgi:hypothetical protein